MSTRSSRFLRLVSAIVLAGAVFSSTSCTTTYDAYGRPQQSVDPGLAIAGVVAAGIIGYAIADDNDHHHYYGNSHYQRSGHRGGYRRTSYGGGYPSCDSGY